MLILAIWSALVLPSALYGRWFYLDLPYLITAGRDFPTNILSILSPYASGRFFPLYLIYYFTAVRFFGTHLAGYYLLQSLIFLASIALTCALFHRISRDIFFTSCLVVMLYFSTPNAENLYTIGKQEPLVYLLIISIVYAFSETRDSTRLRSISLFVAIGILFSFALLTKETAIVLLGMGPTAFMGYLLFRWLDIDDKGSTSYQPYMKLSVALGGGFILAHFPYILFRRLQQANLNRYTDYDITLNLIKHNLLFYVVQQPDVLFFGALSSFLLVSIVRRLYASLTKLDGKLQFDLMLVAGLLASAWAYCVILLLWRWPVGYYPFVPALLFRFGSAYGLFLVVSKELWSRRTVFATFGLVAIFVTYSAAYFWYVATSQLDYSTIYTDAVETYVRISHKENDLVLESFPFYTEPRFETADMISLISGQTRQVQAIADQVNPQVNTPETMRMWHVTQEEIDRNAANLPKKNQYLLVFTGDKKAIWFVRGVAPWVTDDSILKQEGAYDMKLVAEKRRWTPVIAWNFCAGGIKYTRTHTGYKLYRITDDPKLVWTGRSSDGWIGKRASLTLNPSFGERAFVTARTGFNSPNKLYVYRNDVLLTTVSLIEGKENRFELLNNVSPSLFRFEVERVATSPAAPCTLNPDKRQLGVLISVLPNH